MSDNYRGSILEGKNDLILQRMKTKVSQIPKEDLDRGYSFCKELLDD